MWCDFWQSMVTHTWIHVMGFCWTMDIVFIQWEKHTHWRDYNQRLSASSFHITWKISLRIIHTVSFLSSILLRGNLQWYQLLPWIFHSNAPFRCPNFPSRSLLRVMLVTMELVLSSFKMNIPFRLPENPFLVIIYPPLHMRRKWKLFCTQYRSGGHTSYGIISASRLITTVQNISWKMGLIPNTIEMG